MMHQTQQFAETFLPNKAAAVSGAVGAATAVTPTDKLTIITGEWLSTHGVGAISFTEIIQVIGRVGVVLNHRPGNGWRSRGD